jgi:ribosomal protein L35AE/L33A
MLPFLSDLSQKICRAIWRCNRVGSINRAYILTHGVSGVEWAHYRHPLPENVYSTYMKSWKNVNLAVDDR